MKNYFLFILLSFSFYFSTGQTLYEPYVPAAEAEIKRKDTLGAIQVYTKIIENDSTNARAYFERGYLKAAMHQYKEALNDYDKAILLDDFYKDFFHHRGIVKIKLKDYNGAIADFDEAISQLDGFSGDYFYRGLAKAYSNKLTEACADFKKAKKLGSKEADKKILEFCK